MLGGKKMAKERIRTFVNSQGEVVAHGTFSQFVIDLVLADGTRLYSTSSPEYALSIVKKLDIAIVVKGLK